MVLCVRYKMCLSDSEAWRRWESPLLVLSVPGSGSPLCGSMHECSTESLRIIFLNQWQVIKCMYLLNINCDVCSSAAVLAGPLYTSWIPNVNYKDVSKTKTFYVLQLEKQNYLKCKVPPIVLQLLMGLNFNMFSLISQ